MKPIKGSVKIINADTKAVISESPNSVLALEKYLKSLFTWWFDSPRFKLGTIRVITGYPQEDDYFDFIIEDFSIGQPPDEGNFTCSVTIPVQYSKSITSPTGQTVNVPFVGKKIVRLEMLEEDTEVVFASNTGFLTSLGEPYYFLVQPETYLQINWTFTLYENGN